jgi:hypothetical protein
MRSGSNTGTHKNVLRKDTGYVVVYIRHVQGGLGPPYDQFYGRVPPLYTVRIHGVEYAWIYQVPPPVARSVPADFGDTIHFRGWDGPDIAHPGETLAFKLFWAARAAIPADYTLFVHLLGPHGERVTQLDLRYPTRHWQAGRYLTTDLPLTLPDTTPAGTYQLVIGMYESATEQRIPLMTPASDSHLDGPNALPIARITVVPK